MTDEQARALERRVAALERHFESGRAEFGTGLQTVVDLVFRTAQGDDGLAAGPALRWDGANSRLMLVDELGTARPFPLDQFVFNLDLTPTTSFDGVGYRITDSLGTPVGVEQDSAVIAVHTRILRPGSAAGFTLDDTGSLVTLAEAPRFGPLWLVMAVRKRP